MSLSNVALFCIRFVEFISYFWIGSWNSELKATNWIVLLFAYPYIFIATTSQSEEYSCWFLFSFNWKIPISWHCVRRGLFKMCAILTKWLFMNISIQKVKFAHLISQQKELSSSCICIWQLWTNHVQFMNAETKWINKINENCNWFI